LVFFMAKKLKYPELKECLSPLFLLALYSARRYNGRHCLFFFGGPATAGRRGA
jgi:hypothetical protein